MHSVGRPSQAVKTHTSRTAFPGRPSRNTFATKTIAENITSHLGRGVTATVAGHKVVVGNRSLLLAEGCSLDETMDAKLNSIAAAGQSPLLVGIDGRIAGLAAIGDSLRPEAKADD